MFVRLRIISFLFLMVFAATVGRLFFLQVINAGRYEEAAQRQQVVEQMLEPKRGTIFLSSQSGKDVEYIPLALTKRSFAVWASPKDIAPEEVEPLSHKIVPVLQLKEEVVRERLSRAGDPYEPLKEGISEEIIEELKKLEHRAIHWQAMDTRYYPLGELAAHLVGFLGRERNRRVGQYGLEEYYQEALAGRAGYLKGVRNPLGLVIWPFSQKAEPADGADLYLTIDYNIQLLLEKELAEAQKKFSAESASGIIINPKTGAVLAMASLPAFDPNNYQAVESISRFLNPNTQLIFEPGSVFKPITMAVGLDINVISPDLTYNDTGPVEIGTARIKNATGEYFGVQTMTQVLEKSLNTGAVFAVRRIPPGVWRDYLERFGLDSRTNIDLVGEVKGDLKNVSSRRELELATSAFGQGIALTPLELTMAIAALANGGELVEPYLVGRKEIIGSQRSRRVLKPETAEAVTKMMVSVVEAGSGRRARINGYSVAGKTGTAQIPSPQGGYLDETIHSFAGFAPAFDPVFTMLVKIDKPHGARFAETTAVPVFKKVAEFILNYYGLEPDKPL